LKAKRVFLLGILLAVILSVPLTAVYVSAWWNLGLQSKEMNVVNVLGKTLGVDMNGRTSLVNITMVSVYPKTAVEAYSNMFTVHLVFLLSLNSNITEFIVDEIEVNFRSQNQTYTYFGFETLSFTLGTLVDFFRRDSNGGNIAPYSANVSIPVSPGTLPPSPQGVLDLTNRIETFPEVLLHSRGIISDTSLGTFSTSILFDLTKHSTIIYRFNYPPTVWIAYGSSLFIIVVVYLNLIYRRKPN
jgi:hypothetical protein